jgi:hypothetical protein
LKRVSVLSTVRMGVDPETEGKMTESTDWSRRLHIPAELGVAMKLSARAATATRGNIFEW